MTDKATRDRMHMRAMRLRRVRRENEARRIAAANALVSGELSLDASEYMHEFEYLDVLSQVDVRQSTLTDM